MCTCVWGNLMMIVYSHGILDLCTCLWSICYHESFLCCVCMCVYRSKKSDAIYTVPWIKLWTPLINSASAHNALRSLNSSAQVGSMQTPPVPSLITSSNFRNLAMGLIFISFPLQICLIFVPNSHRRQSIVSRNHHHWRFSRH